MQANHTHVITIRSSTVRSSLHIPHNQRAIPAAPQYAKVIPPHTLCTVRTSAASSPIHLSCSQCPSTAMYLTQLIRRPFVGLHGDDIPLALLKGCLDLAKAPAAPSCRCPEQSS